VSAASVAAARHWDHVLPDGRLQCDLCPRGCCLGDGQVGFCVVRRRDGDRIVSTTYGRTTGLCVDPVEKKPLYHFLPGSWTLSFGTLGCNLACRFCQNWHVSRSRDAAALGETASPRAVAHAARAARCASVAFTYNEPIIWAEYAIDTAHACRELGLGTVAVTAGYIGAGARAEFFGAMDAANVDLKGFSPGFYRDVCLAGPGAFHAVLDTLAWLRHDTRVWLEITTLLVPGLNDANEEIEAECRWIADELGLDVPVHFTAFHPAFRMRDVPPTPAATLSRARRIAADHGLRFVYAGNVADREGQSTHCPRCGLAVVERSGFAVTSRRLDAAGRCARCGTEVPGRFLTPFA
jgi:pyruvate formate lyase activating enzyme